AAEDAGAIVHEHDTETVETSGNGSILGGNQAVVDADVPVNVAGNAVGAVLGNAGAAAEETGAAVIEDGADHVHQAAEETLPAPLPEPADAPPLNAELPETPALEVPGSETLPLTAARSEEHTSELQS